MSGPLQRATTRPQSRLSWHSCANFSLFIGSWNARVTLSWLVDVEILFSKNLICLCYFFLQQNTRLTKDHVIQLQSRYVTLLAAIRPHAVNLVDSFDIRDEVLNSTLGAWDGNVYQRLFDLAAQSPLNKDTVHRESFNKYLKPMLKANL